MLHQRSLRKSDVHHAIFNSQAQHHIWSQNFDKSVQSQLQFPFEFNTQVNGGWDFNGILDLREIDLLMKLSTEQIVMHHNQQYTQQN